MNNQNNQTRTYTHARKGVECVANPVHYFDCFNTLAGAGTRAHTHTTISKRTRIQMACKNVLTSCTTTNAATSDVRLGMLLVAFKDSIRASHDFLTVSHSFTVVVCGVPVAESMGWGLNRKKISSTKLFRMVRVGKTSHPLTRAQTHVQHFEVIQHQAGSVPASHTHTYAVGTPCVEGCYVIKVIPVGRIIQCCDSSIYLRPPVPLG